MWVGHNGGMGMRIRILQSKVCKIFLYTRGYSLASFCGRVFFGAGFIIYIMPMPCRCYYQPAYIVYIYIIIYIIGLVFLLDLLTLLVLVE